MERQVRVGHAEGLHARPAAEFVKAASSHPGVIEICLGAKTANAKSLLSVLSLGAKVGETVTLRMDSSEDVHALNLLAGLIEGPISGPRLPQTGQTLLEILGQPETWREATQKVPHIAPQIRSMIDAAQPHLVLFTGCGSSYYLALAAAGFFQEVTGLAARAVPASELVLSSATYVQEGRQSLLFAFSRSGSTTETVMACRKHREHEYGPVVAITCRDGTPLEGEAALCITLPLADDQSVVMTSSFSTMLLSIYLIAARLIEPRSLYEELISLPKHLQTQIEVMRSKGEELGRDLTLTQFVFLGIGPLIGIASEAMLKLKEMTQVPCEAYSPLEFRHGPISIVGPGTLAIMLGSDRAAVQEDAVLRDIRLVGGKCLVLTDETGTGATPAPVTGSRLSEVARSLIYLPLLQCLAYYRALALGRDPDRPQNLSRVVTLDEDDVFP